MSAVKRLSNILSTVSPGPVMTDTKTQPAVVAAAADHFAHIQKAPLDPILGTKILYRKDTDPRKMNLGIGAYRTNDGQPYVLKAVRQAEHEIAADMKLNHEYLPIEGHAGYRKVARALIFGQNSRAIREERIATVQTLSGTGGLRVGFEFVKKHFPNSAVYTSNPTWGNHKAILREAGVPHRQYRYWDPRGRKLDLQGMLTDLSAAPAGSVVLLHACAHNPTGVDPTQQQWREIANVCKTRGLLVFFDSAYQGFASGDLERDAWAVRYFVDQNLPVMLSQSFAKNFGLYNERCGSFNVVCQSKQKAEDVVSRIKLIIRPMYSNPPVHGARIVDKVLNNAALYRTWVEELKGMSGRIIECRHLLRSALERLGTPGDWSHITSQIGMFTFTGLTVAQCKQMKSKHHVYLLDNGRISMAGVNTNNVAYLAQAMDDCVRNF